MLKLRAFMPAAIVAFLASAIAAATPDYDALALKADRMFGYGEWANAAAIYSVMLDSRPSDPYLYGKSIVAAGMLQDTTQQMRLTHLALRNQVPIDSLFASVEQTGMSVAQTTLYENYLLLIKNSEPWLSRNIDSYLLRYYTFRRNGAGMITYSQIMLKPIPFKEEFLYTLAQGYLLEGQTSNAIATYQKIVSLNPNALEALLYLGNYYRRLAATDSAARRQAIDYLSRANKIAPTPYLQSTLQSLAGQ